MFSESKFDSSIEACTDDCPIGNYCTGPWDATGTKNNGGGGIFECDNEWTLAISSQAITEKVGATVTQGASTTGTLKTSLKGATTSVVIQATAGATFLATGDIVIGSTTVVLADINAITSTTLCDTVGSVTAIGMKICSFSQASGGDFTVDKLGCRLANTITLNADKSMSISGIPGTNPSDEPISELQAPGFLSDTLTSTRHFTLGNLYSDTGISLTLSWLKLTGGNLVNFFDGTSYTEYAGACRTADGGYTAWGTANVDKNQAQQVCDADLNCVGFGYTTEDVTGHPYVEYMCMVVEGLCTEASSGTAQTAITAGDARTTKPNKCAGIRRTVGTISGGSILIGGYGNKLITSSVLFDKNCEFCSTDSTLIYGGTIMGYHAELDLKDTKISGSTAYDGAAIYTTNYVYTPTSFAMPSTTTWSQAKTQCESYGEQLCSRTAICPNGKLSAPFGGTRSSDIWVPTIGKYNEWTSIGGGELYTEERLCKTHEDKLGSQPAWGTTTDSQSFRKEVFCCKTMPSSSVSSSVFENVIFENNIASKSDGGAAVKTSALSLRVVFKGGNNKFVGNTPNALTIKETILEFTVCRPGTYQEMVLFTTSSVNREPIDYTVADDFYGCPNTCGGFKTTVGYGEHKGIDACVVSCDTGQYYTEGALGCTNMTNHVCQPGYTFSSPSGTTTDKYYMVGSQEDDGVCTACPKGTDQATTGATKCKYQNIFFLLFSM